MKIELKRITYNKRLSQETSAYAADVWLDGVKRGSVENAGHGGPDMIHPYELAVEINAHAKTLPPIEAFGSKLENCAEFIFADLLNEHLMSAKLQREFKTKTVFVAADGKMYTVKGGMAPRDAVKVLNTMPFPEALKLYLGQAT